MVYILRKGNTFLRSRLAVLMPSADGHAVRAELKQYTQPLKAQKGCVYCFKLSPVEKFEARRYTTYGRYRIRKAEKVSDLMHAEDGADRDGAHWQPSGNRAEGFCCFIMVRHDVCHYCTARSPSDPLDGQCCMLTAVLWRCSSVNLSTAVQDDIPSTTHDLAMLIAAIHQPARAASVRRRSSCAIERESVAAAHRRVRPWCQEARRALSCDD